MGSARAAQMAGAVADGAEPSSAGPQETAASARRWEDASRALTDAGARWCVLRDDSSTGGDVDLLAHPADDRTVDSALRRAGYDRVPAWGRQPHRFYVRRGASGDVKLDVVTEISFGRYHEIRTDLGAAVLAARSGQGGIFQPSPADRQWLVLLHALLDRGHLAARHVAALEPWSGGDGAVRAALPSAVAERCASAAQSGHWQAVESEAAALQGAFAPVGGGRALTWGRRHWRAALRRTTKLQRAVLRPGISVAILGPDGAGKSTVIDHVAAQFPDCRVFYLGAYPKGRAPQTRLPGVGTVVVAGRLVGCGMQAAAQRRRGRTVLLDRHPMEVAYGPPTRSWPTRARRWLIAHTVPAPAKTLVLDGPPELLHARKQEHRVEAIAAMRARYLHLAAERGAVVIDVRAPLDAVVARVVEEMATTPARRGRR